MTVDTVNADGTVDLTSGDTTVPNVARLDSSIVFAGDSVQVLAARGQLLVLGSVATAGTRRVVGRVQITPVASTPTSAVVTYPALRGTGTIAGFTTINSIAPGSAVIATAITGLGSTSATVWVYRTNTVATYVFYSVERVT
jgi:hypothetical protein